MAEKLRVGFAGIKPQDFGIRGFARVADDRSTPLDEVELVAVADVNEDHVRTARERFGFREGYTDYRDMLRTSKLDIAVILLPTFLHKEASIACLKAGLHVLCEKPPTCTYQEMQEVAEVARRSSGLYSFVRQSRFRPNVQAAQRMVAEGRLGEIYCAEAKWIRSRGGQIRGNAWRSEKDRGGGVLLDLGVHGIDQVWFAMGRPTPVEVSAGTYTAFKRFADNPDTYTADDTFAGTIRFDTGAVLQCLFAFGMNGVGPAGPNPRSDLPYATEWQVSRIYGTEAGIDINDCRVVRGTVDSVTVDTLPNEDDGASPMERQARDFIRAIRTRTPPTNSLEDALVLMHMLSALAQSGTAGHSVRLD